MSQSLPSLPSEHSEFKTIINFHGLLLTVVDSGGIDYIPLKPIVELLGTQWKSARETAFSGDNCELYGTCELNEPIFNGFSTLKGTKKAVFILLEATETYLMRTNTSRMRENGNVKAADYLLNLQKEWRKALHEYETEGLAYNRRVLNKKKDLGDLLKARKCVKNPVEVAALDRMIADEFSGLGYPLNQEDNPQGELNLRKKGSNPS